MNFLNDPLKAVKSGLNTAGGAIKRANSKAQSAISNYQSQRQAKNTFSQQKPKNEMASNKNVLPYNEITFEVKQDNFTNNKYNLVDFDSDIVQNLDLLGIEDGQEQKQQKMTAVHEQTKNIYAQTNNQYDELQNMDDFNPYFSKQTLQNDKSKTKVNQLDETKYSIETQKNYPNQQQSFLSQTSNNNYKDDLFEMRTSIPKKLNNSLLMRIINDGRQAFSENTKLLLQSEDVDQSLFNSFGLETQQLLVNLVNILNKKENISIFELRNFMFNNGIPFIDYNEVIHYTRDNQFDNITRQTQISHAFRALTWRLMCGTLSSKPSQWDEETIKNLNEYQVWTDELITKENSIRSLYLNDNPDDYQFYCNQYKLAREVFKQERIDAIRQQNKKEGYVEEDEIIDKQSLKFQSQWSKYMKDLDLFDTIWKDVRRTRQELSLFQLPLDINQRTSLRELDRLEIQKETFRIDLEPWDFEKYIETHSDALSRILFIYAKLNPGVCYIQGMNEVLAVVYYCFWLGGSFLPFEQQSLEKTKRQQLHLEADVFSTFSNIMMDLRDSFLRELDREATGLDGHIFHYDNVLQVVNEKVWENIVEEAQMNHQYYTLRWFMLLMSQEFDYFNTIRLWDTLLAAEKQPGIENNQEEQQEEEKYENKNQITQVQRFQFIDYVAVALTLNVQQKIIDSEGDFADIMEALQHTSKSVQSLSDLENLLKESKRICMSWMRWLNQELREIEAQSQSKKQQSQRRGTFMQRFRVAAVESEENDQSENLETQEQEQHKKKIQKYQMDVKIYEELLFTKQKK